MEWKDIVPYTALIVSVLTLVFNRIDKARKDGKEDNMAVISYQVKEIKEDVKDILIKLDKQESEIDEKINKRIEMHELMYHKRSKRNDS